MQFDQSAWGTKLARRGCPKTVHYGHPNLETFDPVVSGSCSGGGGEVFGQVLDARCVGPLAFHSRWQILRREEPTGEVGQSCSDPNLRERPASAPADANNLRTLYQRVWDSPLLNL